MKKRHYLQVFAIRLCTVCSNVFFTFSIITVSPSQFYFYSISDSEFGSNSDAKPDFDLIWDEYSVILLFFSNTMKKRPYLQVFAIRLCMY
jgi:hypothetical protein